MTIVLRTVMAGPAGTHQPGEKLTLAADEERGLVEGGYAVFDKPAARGETASVQAPENAAQPPVSKARAAGARRARG